MPPTCRAVVLPMRAQGATCVYTCDLPAGSVWRKLQPAQTLGEKGFGCVYGWWAVVSTSYQDMSRTSTHGRLVVFTMVRWEQGRAEGSGVFPEVRPPQGLPCGGRDPCPVSWCSPPPSCRVIRTRRLRPWRARRQIKRGGRRCRFHFETLIFSFVSKACKVAAELDYCAGLRSSPSPGHHTGAFAKGTCDIS